MSTMIGETELFSRAEWGADPTPNLNRPMSAWTETNLHHTVGSTPSTFSGECVEMRSIERIHKGNGWPTCGYTVVVARSGRAFVGFETTQNPWLSTRGVHTMNRNHTSLAISLMGNYQNLYIGPVQRQAILDLYWYFEANKGQVPLMGHRDWFATACPGINAYNQLPSLNAATPVAPEPPDWKGPSDMAEFIAIRSNGAQFIVSIDGAGATTLGLPSLPDKEAVARATGLKDAKVSDSQWKMIVKAAG